jgi:hypothetical protein
MFPNVDGETNRCEAVTMTKIPFAALVPAVLLGGCIQVKAPDKPIEINLNVNIKQEVVVRLEKDVDEAIKNNPGVF